jgi:aerobic carbon-monoxide dehydrogenase small subunit
MTELAVLLNVNGNEYSLSCSPTRTLLQVLRDDLGLTGTKEGCSTGDCGACVVVMNDVAVNSCMVLAPQAEGAGILTVEGLAVNGQLSVLQQKFIEKWAFQCGFCTPGMLMSAYALLLHNPDPTEAEIKTAVEGNLCRCTNYQFVVDAIQETAADEIAASSKGKSHA